MNDIKRHETAPVVFFSLTGGRKTWSMLSMKVHLIFNNEVKKKTKHTWCAQKVKFFYSTK